MVIPSAETIESANDQLGKLDAAHLEQQKQELHSAVGDTSLDFIQGYELGLQTARVFLAGNPAAIAAGVEL